MIIFRQQRLSELQNDFINNMTHEFKTPITSIKLASEGLEKYTFSNEKNPRADKYIHIIKEQSQLLNDQVEKVLDLAKSTSSSIQLKKERVEIVSLLQELTNIENQKSEAQINFIYSRNNISVLADRLHFTNIIRNLVDNALKYNRNNNPIKIVLTEEERYTSLAVIDQGIGISEKETEQIFDKFYRVNTGDVHNVKGFGLGLYYVKNICKAHNWGINVKSSEGTGTAFTIKMNK